jgi:ATP-dependent Clp protease protease subunit
MENGKMEERVQVITEKLMEKRTVLLSEINQDSAIDLISRLLFLQTESSDPINLLIKSGGGDIDAAWLICDVIEHFLVAPVNGTAIGYCDSSATFVLLHCNERKATPHTKFIIHSGKMNNLSVKMDEVTTKNLQELSSEAQKYSEEIIEMYTKKLGGDEKTVKGYIRQGDQKFNKSITAEKALEINLINEIVEGKLDIF